MPIEVAPLAAGILSFVPGLLALFLLYSPYDGAFKDNIVFLWFIGGLLAGTAVGFLDELIFAPPFLVYILGAPFLEQGAKLVFLNRRKWQEERQAVWNGGAMGAGMSAMLALVVATRAFAGGFDLERGLYVAAIATGLGFVHVASGIVLGWGVLRARPFQGYLLAAAGTMPLTLLLFSVREAADPVFAVLLVAYGVAALVAAYRIWLPHGASVDFERRKRRAVRAERRGG